MPARTSGHVVPPPLTSFAQYRAQVEASSRAQFVQFDGDRLLRAWGTPDRPFPVAVEPGRRRWRVTAWGVPPSTARQAAREIFSFADPLGEFYVLTRREPVLAGTERRFRGLRIPRDGSLYEALLHSIVGQQLSVRAANTIKRRWVEASGSRLSVDGFELAYLPGPTQLLRDGPARLRSVGLSGAKSRALGSLAKAFRSGALDETAAWSGPLDAAVARLVAEPGVGRWTAENALLRGVGRRDLFIAGDLGVRLALGAFRPDRSPWDEDAARRWGTRWYPGWGSYATLYLWRRWVLDGPAARAG